METELKEKLDLFRESLRDISSSSDAPVRGQLRLGTTSQEVVAKKLDFFEIVNSVSTLYDNAERNGVHTETYIWEIYELLHDAKHTKNTITISARYGKFIRKINYLMDTKALE